MNEEGKRLTSRTVTVRGKKVPLTLCRMVLQFNSPDARWPEDPAELLQASKAGKQGKGKKGKGGASNTGSEDLQLATPDDVSVDGTAKLFVEEISSTRGATFDLKAVQEPFKNAGRYGNVLLLETFQMLVARTVAFCRKLLCYRFQVEVSQRKLLLVGKPLISVFNTCRCSLRAAPCYGPSAPCCAHDGGNCECWTTRGDRSGRPWC